MKIVSDFGNPLFDLAAVYEEFPYSKRYLQRLFIKDYGISPSQFLLQQRLNAAIKYLNQTIKNDYSIAEISDRCGFGDQYYFSRIFKKQLGVCPKEYRQGKISTPPRQRRQSPFRIVNKLHFIASLPLQISSGLKKPEVFSLRGRQKSRRFVPLFAMTSRYQNALSLGVRACVS